MVYKRGKNYNFEFWLYGVRIRETTKKRNETEAENSESRRRTALADAVSAYPPEQRHDRLTEHIATEKARAKAAKLANNPEPARVTFRDQSEKWIKSLAERKRRPVKPATIAGWEHALKKWVNPILGDRPLCEIGNSDLKELVTKMHAAKLSPKTIVNYTQAVKATVASAINKDGIQLFPVAWNRDFIDMPVVKPTEQERQTISALEIEKSIAESPKRYRMLFALLAGSGLRIGEALGLKPSDFSADRRELHVTRSLWRGKEQAPKTANAIRTIDLVEPLARVLTAFMEKAVESDYVFKTASGSAISQRNSLRALHATKVKVGLHAFRRFRTETLRRAGAPPDLVSMWLGHSAKSITDNYAKGLRDDLKWRQSECERIGLGFELGPLIGPQAVEPANEAEAA